MAVTMKITVFWYFTLCSTINGFLQNVCTYLPNNTVLYGSMYSNCMKVYYDIGNIVWEYVQ
jgi:hypothetical protein